MSESSAAPHVIVVAGPNGSGKSTSAPHLLRDALAVSEFVNADPIAAGLSAFRPESVAMAAGRIMVTRIQQLAAERANFAFETTLASRSFAHWLEELKRGGYRVSLLFLWLDSADLAVSRVAERVRLGGHHVPEEVVRRRYERGLRNFFQRYSTITDHWQLFDNSRVGRPRLVAAGEGRSVSSLADPVLWQKLRETYDA